MRIALIDSTWPDPTSTGLTHSVERVAFSSTRHFVDYDIVIWDPVKSLNNYIPEYPAISEMNRSVTSRFLADKKRHFGEIETMIEQGKLVVILVPLAWNFDIYRTSSSVQQTNVTDHLPVKCKTQALQGDTVEIRTESNEIKTFAEAIQHLIAYTSYLTETEGTLFLYTTANQPVASLISKKAGHFLLQPHIDTKGNYGSNSVRRYIDAVVEFAEALEGTQAPISLPDWADGYEIPNETETKGRLEMLNKQKNEIGNQIAEEVVSLKKLQDLKFLFAGGTGDHLVSLTIEALNELGIEAKEGPKNRDDLILSYDKTHGVSEVKGKTKSAAEEDAAQLQKWVSGYHEQHKVEPKGILIINHYRDTPLSERTEEAFPDQMLDYSNRMRMCLITSTQLLQLVLFVRDNPEQKKEVAQSIFETIGRYAAFEEERAKYLIK